MKLINIIAIIFLLTAIGTLLYLLISMIAADVYQSYDIDKSTALWVATGIVVSIITGIGCTAKSLIDANVEE